MQKTNRKWPCWSEEYLTSKVKKEKSTWIRTKRTALSSVRRGERKVNSWRLRIQWERYGGNKEKNVVRIQGESGKVGEIKIKTIEIIAYCWEKDCNREGKGIWERVRAKVCRVEKKGAVGSMLRN